MDTKLPLVRMLALRPPSPLETHAPIRLYANPVNVPGTSDEYPNWRVPLSGPGGEVVGVEQLRGSLLARRVMGAAGGRVG